MKLYVILSPLGEVVSIETSEKAAFDVVSRLNSSSAVLGLYKSVLFSKYNGRFIPESE